MPQIIDMTPGGEFVAPPAPHASWQLRLGIGAAAVALVAGGLVVAAVLLWIASFLLPIAILAAFVAYVAFRMQTRQRRR